MSAGTVQAPPVPPVDPSPGTPIRVLLIEDSRDDADLLAWELERAGVGHALQRAMDREALREALSGTRPDVVVCDSRLPGLGGDEAQALVLEAWPGVPFVFCVGVVDEQGPMAEAIRRADATVCKDRLVEMPDVLGRVLRHPQGRA